MASGICDTRRTRLDYADVRPSCVIGASYQSPGNVQVTPIGLVRDGQLVEGLLPPGDIRDRCSVIRRKPAGRIC